MDKLSSSHPGRLTPWKEAGTQLMHNYIMTTLLPNKVKKVCAKYLNLNKFWLEKYSRATFGPRCAMHGTCATCSPLWWGTITAGGRRGRRADNRTREIPSYWPTPIVLHHVRVSVSCLSIHLW